MHFFHVNDLDRNRSLVTYVVKLGAMTAFWKSTLNTKRPQLAELGRRYQPTGACIRVIDLNANLLPGNYVYRVAEVSLTATIYLTQHG
jgi:hypothetical protein